MLAALQQAIPAMVPALTSESCSSALRWILLLLRICIMCRQWEWNLLLLHFVLAFSMPDAFFRQ